MFFDEWVARRYAVLWPELFAPAVVDPAVKFLATLAGAGGAGGGGAHLAGGGGAHLAGAGSALELGIGTGRVALPLSRAGVRVRGIELSTPMVRQLRAEPGGGDIDVTIGDLASVTVGEQFALVYLVRNTITNLTGQDHQVQAFRNAARHLTPGGFFVIENYIPQLRRLPSGETKHVFVHTPTHLGFEEYDLASQIAYSHHHWVIDGELRQFSTPHRYVWPAELDLMARIAGLELRQRWSDWNRAAFTGDSQSHISVWQKPARPTAH